MPLDGGPSSTALATATPAAPPMSPTGDNVAMMKLAQDIKEAKAAPEVDTPVPAEVPKKQWWYRPPDSKARKLVEKIVVMREAGHEDKAIAKRLKTTEQSVRQYMYMGRKNGWLNAEDEPVDLELELALNVDRKVVRNVSASLDGQMTNWQTHEMTIAAAKGRGIFKSHEVSKNDGGNALSVVAIKVIMPAVGASDQMPEIREDQMGGVPAYVEGEVFDVDARPALTAGDTGAGPEGAVGAEYERPAADEGSAD